MFWRKHPKFVGSHLNMQLKCICGESYLYLYTFLKHNTLLDITLYGKVNLGKRRRCPRRYNFRASVLDSIEVVLIRPKHISVRVLFGKS